VLCTDTVTDDVIVEEEPNDVVRRVVAEGDVRREGLLVFRMEALEDKLLIRHQLTILSKCGFSFDEAKAWTSGKEGINQTKLELALGAGSGPFCLMMEMLTLLPSF